MMCLQGLHLLVTLLQSTQCHQLLGDFSAGLMGLSVIGDSSWSLSVSSVGMDSKMLLSILICGLQWTLIRAISLYAIGSLGCNCLVNWVKSLLWLDSASLLEEQGLKALGLKSKELRVLDVWGNVGVTWHQAIGSGIVGVIAGCDEASRLRGLTVILGRVEAMQWLLGCVLSAIMVGLLALCLVMVSSLVMEGLPLGCVPLTSLMCWNAVYVLLLPGCWGACAHLRQWGDGGGGWPLLWHYQVREWDLARGLAQV